MREFVTWGTALAFLLTALYAVTVRREIISAGRNIGALSHDVAELSRRNDNLALEVSRLRSPAALAARAAEFGVVPPKLLQDDDRAKR